MRVLLLASGLRFMGGFTLGVWIVPFYREAFPGLPYISLHLPISP